jgi:hypothetical protein
MLSGAIPMGGNERAAKPLPLPKHLSADHAGGTDAEQLRLLITGIAEIVRSYVLDASDAHEAERAALAAVSERGVDKTALQRFRDWTLSTLRAGSTSAAVAALSSATATLLIEAGHLASHLG